MGNSGEKQKTTDIYEALKQQVSDVYLEVAKAAGI